ncbi:MAG: GUN4 domain-containing protein [Nostoc sp.]|uniref:GUN4 domain-containing protein n=1 Tax=Nostoc sp. TaxID=1180 RepID=UPI002FF86425
MGKNNKTGIYLLTLLVIAGLFSVAGAIVWYGFTKPGTTPTATPFLATNTLTNPKSTVAVTPDIRSTNPHSLDEVQLRSDRNVDYSKLREYLQLKDWRSADRETYLRMLDAAGPKAQASGMTPQDEMNTLPCTDLRTIDQLWSVASNGQQGFTLQMNIVRALGDYRRMYDKVGWQKLPPSNEWLFQLTYNPQTRRMEFLPGKEPNYKDPPPGHLPTVEIGYNFNVALSGALGRCRF